ncbi:hypothetical protein AURDEDRAFT_111795 [Auricularia subglabra TFB-10046 SS5]|nr:hypothetical protein AURDEDRAFT_111795 [Auricularia subglabra TFB-10046 SS5]
MDERWILGFFDALALKILKTLVELPDDLRPNALHRWLQVGYTFSHWLVANVWFLSPFVHSEDMADHGTLHRFISSTRTAVQERTHHTDPRILSPVTTTDELFGILRAGPHKDESGDVAMHNWVYWVLAVYEGQSYLLRTFDGRCPFYNGALGRKDTQREKEFLDSFNRMGCVPPELESRITEDIRAGRWTPLGG